MQFEPVRRFKTFEAVVDVTIDSDRDARRQVRWNLPACFSFHLASLPSMVEKTAILEKAATKPRINLSFFSRPALREHSALPAGLVPQAWAERLRSQAFQTSEFLSSEVQSGILLPLEQEARSDSRDSE